MTVKDYSTTAASNTSINGVNIAEGMSPSGVNNAIRQELKDVRDVWNDKEWFILGDGDGAAVFTRASSTSITVPTDITSTHHVGRRVKVYGSNTGTIYGKIATSSYSAPNTTLAFTFDSGSISGSDSTVDVYVGSTYVSPAIPVIHDTSLGTSAVLPPSQGAVKTYVDTQVTAQDLDFEGDSGSSNVDLDSQSFDIAGGSGITTTASGQTLTVAGDDATTSAKTVPTTNTTSGETSTTPVVKDETNSSTTTETTPETTD